MADLRISLHAGPRRLFISPEAHAAPMRKLRCGAAAPTRQDILGIGYVELGVPLKFHRAEESPTVLASLAGYIPPGPTRLTIRLQLSLNTEAKGLRSHSLAPGCPILFCHRGLVSCPPQRTLHHHTHL